MAVTNNGTVYVADGYCNARVAEYAPDGTWRSSFVLPQPGKLQIPHSLAIDECEGALYVADREAAAVHAFSLATRQLTGACLAVCYVGLAEGVTEGCHATPSPSIPPTTHIA